MEGFNSQLSKEQLSRGPVRELYNDIVDQSLEGVREYLREFEANTHGNEEILKDRLLRAELRRAGWKDIPWHPETDEKGPAVLPANREIVDSGIHTIRQRLSESSSEQEHDNAREMAQNKNRRKSIVPNTGDGDISPILKESEIREVPVVTATTCTSTSTTVTTVAQLHNTTTTTSSAIYNQPKCTSTVLGGGFNMKRSILGAGNHQTLTTSDQSIMDWRNKYGHTSTAPINNATFDRAPGWSITNQNTLPQRNLDYPPRNKITNRDIERENYREAELYRGYDGIRVNRETERNNMRNSGSNCSRGSRSNKERHSDRDRESKRDKRHKEKSNNSVQQSVYGYSSGEEDKRRDEDRSSRRDKKSSRRSRERESSSWGSDSDLPIRSRKSKSRANKDSNNYQLVRVLQSWSLKFSGNYKEDPEEFLHRLEKCRDSMSCKDRELFKMLHCIFTEGASRWYSTTEDKFESWRKFKKAFRCQFIREINEEDIYDELKARTQGKDEKITNYLSCFQYIMDHFKTPLPIERRLNIAYQNLLPEYRIFIGNRDVYDFDDLERFGRQWEKQKEITSRYAPPPSKEQSRIPGAAYVKEQKTVKIAGVTAQKNTEKVNTAVESESEAKANKKTEKPGALKTFNEVVRNPVKNSRVRVDAASTENMQHQSNNELRYNNYGNSKPANNVINNSRQNTVPQHQRYNQSTPQRTENRDNTGSAPFYGECHICHKIGHRSSQCYQRTCYRCSKIGHSSFECPQRPSPPRRENFSSNYQRDNERQNDGVSCQGCGARGVTIKNCKNCAHIFRNLGNGQTGTQNHPVRST